MKYLVLFLSIFLNNTYATDCSTIWRNGFPDVVPTHTPVPCDEFLPSFSPPTISQRYYTVSSLTLDESVKSQMEMIAEAVSYSAAKLSTYGRVPNITVIRQDISHPNSGGAAAMGFTYVQFFDLNIESCPIFIYPISSVLNKEHLQQMVAHEVFHCVQKMNFKDQVTSAMNSSDSGWWFEGLAQLFSNYVYPRNDFEYTSRFPAPDQTMPFFDQENSYSSENFWQSYANTLNDNDIFNLMGMMPTSSGNAPANIAINLPRISEALHNYGKQITLKKVRDAGGHMSPYDMAFENRVVADIAHQQINLPHYDFTVGAYSLTLPKAGKWQLRFNPPEGTKISFKKVDESEYHAVTGMVEITSECESERVVQIVITRASDQQSMGNTRLIIDRALNPECDCVSHPDTPPQIDLCLLGSWMLDHGSVAQFWNRTNTNPRVRFESSTGGFTVTFREDHTAIWGASSWALSANGDMGNGMIMSLTRTTNGTSTFRYSANGNLTCTSGLAMNMSAVQVMSMAGRVVSTTSVLPFSPSEGSFSYSCTPTDFIFRVYNYQGTGHLIDYVFHRL